LKPGESYWIRTLLPGDTQVRLSNNSQAIDLGPQETFLTTIVRGYNQIGNPSPYTIRVQDLKFLTERGGGIITFDQAVNSGFIRQTLFEYDPKTRQYVRLGRDSLIQPGRGVWIFATGERTIVWPAPEGPGRSITP
jgi:hypothetical protein